jgi:hypothetical protein
MDDPLIVSVGLAIFATGFSVAFLAMLMLGLLFTTFAAIRHLIGVS